MAWSIGSDVTAGSVLTASRYNQDVLANLSEFAPLFTTFTTWTTTVTQSVTVTHNRTYARYVKIGRLVIASCLLSITGTGTGNNAITVSLPVTAAGSVPQIIGSGRVVDQTTADYQAIAYLASTTTVAFWLTNGTTSNGGNPIGASPNFALASPDTISCTVIYEAAS